MSTATGYLDERADADRLQRASPRPFTPDVTAAAVHHGWWRHRALQLFVSVTLVRLAFATTAFTSSWRVSYDEPAELAIARFLGGRGKWMLFHAPEYQPGVGLLVAPVAALGGDPAAVFHAAVALNCVMAGLSALVLAAVLCRVTSISSAAAQVIAAFVALAPAVVPLSAHSWADPAVTLTLLLATLGVHEYATRGGTRWGIVGVGACIAGYLFHGRMLPALAAATLLSGTIALRRRRWSDLATIVVLAGGGFAIVRLVSARISRELWQVTSDTNSAGSTLERLADPAAVLRSLLGQAWYQVVATTGIAAVGAVVLVLALVRRGATVGLQRRSAAVIIAMAAPMVATSAVFTSGRAGAHFLVYGRYNDDALWVVMALGLAGIWNSRASTRRLVVLGLVVPLTALTASTALVEGVLGGAVRGDVVHEMVNAMVALGGPGRVVPWAVALTAGACLALVVLALIGAPARPGLAVVLAALLLLLGSARIFSTRFGDTPTDVAAAVRGVDELVPPGSVIGYRFTYSGYFDNPDNVARLAQNYQYWLSGHQFVLVNNGDAAPLYTLSVDDDPHVADIATVIWSDPAVPHVLWKLNDPNVARPSARP